MINDKKSIVKFTKLKLFQKVLRIKKELKNIDPSEFDFPEGTAIFINEIFCFYYKMLWNKCKKLWVEKKLIYTYFTSNGNIRYRITKSGNVHTVTHITDLKENFPDTDINALQIFSDHCCSLTFGFWITYAWDVLEIFVIANSIFCGFTFEKKRSSHCSYISHNFSYISFWLNINYSVFGS